MNKVALIVLCFLTFKALGQPPVDINSYLNNKQISKAAKDYYSGKFKADDGDKTFSILDSLNTRNNATRPFYLYLASRMMNKVDGALSEGLGNAVKEYFEMKPDNVLDFLYSENKLVCIQYKNNWANAIAGEFMIICENKVKECIRKSFQQTLTKVKTQNKPKATQFYKLIENYVR